MTANSRDVVLETRVSVSRRLETQIPKSRSWSWSWDLESWSWSWVVKSRLHPWKIGLLHWQVPDLLRFQLCYLKVKAGLKCMLYSVHVRVSKQIIVGHSFKPPSRNQTKNLIKCTYTSIKHMTSNILSMALTSMHMSHRYVADKPSGYMEVL